MHNKDLYKHVLNLPAPWEVYDVIIAPKDEEITVKVRLTTKAIGSCPKCDSSIDCPGYDTRVKKWQHLDTCQYKTILEASVPRVKCQKHGIVTIQVPWSEPGSSFTALFEALVIDWLQEASISAVSKQLRVSWNAIDGIMSRAVKRGLLRRNIEEISNINIDEKAFKKHHEYVSIVYEKGRVLHVGDGRKSDCLNEFFEGLSQSQKENIRSISMDMWPAYINLVRHHIPDANKKISFDKFHVAQHLGDAVDKVRKQEHTSLQAVGNDVLKGTKYDWLKNPDNMSSKDMSEFSQLLKRTIKTTRAWGIKELGMSLWNYASRTWAEKAWGKWYSWAIRSRLEPIKKVAKMIKKHLWGIINAIVLGVNNGRAEGINSQVQRIKNKSCGFRNKERFRNAIYFHLGGLHLYPDGVKR